MVIPVPCLRQAEKREAMCKFFISDYDKIYSFWCNIDDISEAKRGSRNYP